MVPGMAALFIGLTAVWYSFADPEGGVLQAFQRVMAGKPAAGEIGAASGAQAGLAVGTRLSTKDKQRQTIMELLGETIEDGLALGGGDGGGGGKKDKRPAIPGVNGGRPGESVKINPDGSKTYGDAEGNPIAPSGTSGSGSAIVAEAKRYLGTPYVYGGHSKKGFDCAGFTHYVAEAFGVNLAWYVGGQLGNAGAFTKVTRAQLQPGDWVFYGVAHVAIYVGGDSVIHAPRPGTRVRIEGGMGNTPGVRAYRRLKVKSKGTSA